MLCSNIYSLEAQSKLELKVYSHLRAEHFHPKHVQLLPLTVHGTHVDHALHAQQGANRRRGHAMLSGARLGNDAVLTDALRQERLTHSVVDLVCARVGKLLALQPDLCFDRGHPQRQACDGRVSEMCFGGQSSTQRPVISTCSFSVTLKHGFLLS